ncbi:GNAT family N-acetyltransferase [Schumannella luteola]|uniref:GNAT superfamily N-acetyltransferase n=1 Tax=Schumannella luteola TaxID=472059 RepID=A0A852YDS7_9MICO|nr:GNAT family N-acetyltransferase [Schumannella luteola]NYG97817.1 GNAT superfamily N-acetyltransferase [Schumannella luteola]TPX02921.1 GNAT family N-acetyltransferase [Schumannella luteola]
MLQLTLPMTLSARDTEVEVRRATSADAPAIIALLADDAISASRGDIAADEDAPAYLAALEQILADPANDLVVTIDHGARGHSSDTADEPQHTVVGTLQLTRIPGMARRGATRLTVEAVRVRGDRRSSGIGGALMRWVVEQAAPDLGVVLVQLTSHVDRVDAHRFYERLGFERSHAGFTISIPAR